VKNESIACSGYREYKTADGSNSQHKKLMSDRFLTSVYWRVVGLGPCTK